LRLDFSFSGAPAGVEVDDAERPFCLCDGRVVRHGRNADWDPLFELDRLPASHGALKVLGNVHTLRLCEGTEVPSDCARLLGGVHICVFHAHRDILFRTAAACIGNTGRALVEAHATHGTNATMQFATQLPWTAYVAVVASWHLASPGSLRGAQTTRRAFFSAPIFFFFFEKK
jgi:hypothetical protein